MHAGWFNLLGQVAVTAAIEYSLASHLACMIVLGTGGADNGGHIVTQKQLLGIYAGKAIKRKLQRVEMQRVESCLAEVDLSYHSS